ncbi:histidine kinase dimerization/phospho-acceptor domain-containing protein [Actinomadura welshii]
MTAHLHDHRLFRSARRQWRNRLAGSRHDGLLSRFTRTSPRLALIVAFAAPLGYCLLPEPSLAPLAALAVLLGDGLLYRDWPRATAEAAFTAFALAVTVPLVTAAGLPSPTPDTAQAAALLVVAVLINIVTSQSVRAALTVDSLTGAGCAVAFAVLVLKAVNTGQALWGLLALVPVGAHLLGAGVLATRERALRTAERLLGLPHLVAAGRTTGEDLVPFTAGLRRIMGSDVLWLRLTLPCGGAWIEASAGAEGVRPRPPEGFDVFERRGRGHPAGCWHVPGGLLPDGWRAGVYVPVTAPDGNVAGYLLLGWTRLSGRYLATWMTNGVLGGAVISTARALGAFWTEAHAAHQLEAERSRLSAVVDHSGVAVLALDEGGSVVVWNVALANLLGVDAGRALGRRPEELFTLTDEDGGTVGLVPGLRGSVQVTTPAGRSLWVQVSCSGPAVAATPRLLTAVFVDESAQRQLECMRRLLVRSVHHELHGPLTAIRGHGQLLEESLAGETAADSPGAILDAVEMMHHVIGDLVHVVSAARPRPHRPRGGCGPSNWSRCCAGRCAASRRWRSAR